MEKFNHLSINKKIKYIFFSCLLIFSFHLFPLFFVGDLIVYISDNLDLWIPQSVVASKILTGDFGAAKVFMNEELPWTFVYGSLFPINLIYNYFDISSAYLSVDILVRIIGFLSFFYFIKNYHSSLILKIFASCLFSSFLVTTNWGFGVATFPYLLSICLKKKNISIKNYIALSIIALNTDLYLHGIYIYYVIFFYLIFFLKISRENLSNLLKIFLVYSFFILISNFNLIYSILVFSPFQFQLAEHTLNDNFSKILYDGIISFFKPYNVNAYFFPNIFVIALLNLSIILSLIKKVKINLNLIKLLLLLQISIIFFSTIQNYEIFSALKGAKLNRISYLLPFFHTFLIFNLINEIKVKKINLFYSLLIISILYNQISPSAFTVIKEKLNYDQLSEKNKSLIKRRYEKKEFLQLIIDMKRLSPENQKNTEFIRGSHYANSIRSYYRVNDYKIIKRMVKDSKTFSIGLDPFKAVVSDIKVIGGYYRYYPSAYKKKYNEIIKEQIEYIESLNENFDRKKRVAQFKDQGMFLYSNVRKGDDIRINFEKLKTMNVGFVISGFKIYNENVSLICDQCNGNKNLYLYSLQ